jgi:DNA transposition AAA+ family ATPase
MIFDKYTKKINAIKEYASKNSDDLETIHMDRDELYKTFIRDICTNKFKDKKEIELIAKMLKKECAKLEGKNKFWYA